MFRKGVVTMSLCAILASCTHHMPKHAPHTSGRHTSTTTIPMLPKAPQGVLDRDTQVTQALTPLTIHDGNVYAMFSFKGDQIGLEVPLGTYMDGVQVETSADTPNHEALSFSRIPPQRPYIRALTNVVAPRDMTKRERVSAIFEFITGNIHRQEDWDNSYISSTTSLLKPDLRKTPLQTLFEAGGDCDDYSIVAKEMLNAIDIPAVCVYLYPKQILKSAHMVVGIPYCKDIFTIPSETILETQYTFITFHEQVYVLLESQKKFTVERGYYDASMIALKAHDGISWTPVRELK